MSLPAFHDKKKIECVSRMNNGGCVVTPDCKEICYIKDCEGPRASAVRWPTEDERLDDPRHGQAAYINRKIE
jgi:hypothetical protein